MAIENALDIGLASIRNKQAIISLPFLYFTDKLVEVLKRGKISKNNFSLCAFYSMAGGTLQDGQEKCKYGVYKETSN